MNARLLSIGLLAASFVLMRYPETPLPTGAPEKRLAGFPMAFDGWTGKEEPFQASVMEAVDADDSLHRRYEAAQGGLWLYVGYYGTQKGGRTGHLPQHCYPAAGYKVLDLGKETLVQANGQPVAVNRLLTERNGQKTMVLYWIQSGDQKVLADGFAMNFSRLTRRLTQGRDDGAFVRISSVVSKSEADTLAAEKKFSVDVLDRIAAYWPLEKGPQI